MFSKFFLNLALLGVIILATSCGLKTGEKNPEPAPAKVKSAQCLTKSIAELKIYFKGEATDKQVDNSVTCLEEVFVAFKDNIRGAKKNVFTPREIASFVELNFLSEDDSKFSDGFLNQLMFFKVALFGGAEDVITKSEIDLIVNLIGKFKSDLIALNPHMRILTMNWSGIFSRLSEPVQEEKFIAAKDQFEKTLLKLTAEFAEGRRAYRTDHLAEFAVEILKFTKAEQETVDTLQKGAPLLTEAKKVFIGGEASLQGAEWNQLGIIIHEAYFQLLRYEYFLKDLDDTQTDRKWNAYEKIASDVIALLENVLQSKKVITTSEWLQFVLVAQKQKVLDTTFTEKALTMAFDALWSNILNPPEDRLKGLSRPGFDLVALQQITPEIRTWIGTQRHIAQIFTTSSQWKKDMISAEFQAHIDSESDVTVKKALTGITGILSEAVPLTLNDSGMMKILDLATSEYHQGDLTLSNISRLLARVLIRAYATDIQRVNEFTSITQEEAQKAYDQLKPIAVDFDIIDKSNETFIRSRFLESNLFLSVSNGDKFVSFGELHHLIVHIFSGIARSTEIKDELVKRPDFIQKCLLPTEGQTSIKGSTRVSEQCILDQYVASTTGFEGMPQYIELRHKHTEAELRDFYMALLKAAGHIPREDKTVLMSDADLFPHVVQYIEMVYARHDANRDNLLQVNEAKAAFPVFKDLLADLVKSYKQIKEEDLEGVFIYILKFGRPPRPTSIGEVLKFVAFIKDKTQKDWVINTTRLELGKIFNYIADATSAVPAAPKPPVTPATPAEPAPVEPKPTP